MKYLIYCSLVTLLFVVYCVALYSCSDKDNPNTTTVEYGTSENGKDKTTKGIKQTFKWSK